MLLKNHKAGILLFFTAVTIRLAALIATHRLTTPQLWDYEIIATHIVQGKGFVYPYLDTLYYNYGPLVYPYLCAGVYFLTHHSFLAMTLLQTVVSAASCVAAAVLASVLGGVMAGWWAGGLMAIHPGLVYYVTVLHPLNIDVLLCLLCLLAFLYWANHPTVGWGLFVGILSMVSVFSLGSIGLFFPFALVWWWRGGTGSARRKFLSLAAWGVGVALSLSPLVVRNARLYHQLVISRTDNGMNFWYGNNPNATGTSYTFHGMEMFDVAPASFKQEVYKADELGQRDLFYRAAWDFIRQRPTQFFKLVARKWFYFWWHSPHQGFLYPKPWTRLYQIFYALLLIFALAGIGILTRRGTGRVKPVLILILLLLGSVSGVYAFFYVEGRHRWVLEPLLICLASVALVRLGKGPTTPAVRTGLRYNK